MLHTETDRTAIVLVRPQMGENIGAAARAMMNFGLFDLRIVSPRDGWPNDKATQMAAKADGIISNATLHASLEEALHDRHYSYACTARPRDLEVPCVTPREAAHGNRSRAALVFGPENNGLHNDDIAACHSIITIPTDARNSSLNLAQSVVVCAYEFFSGQDDTARFSEKHVAEAGEVFGLYDDIVSQLERTNYYGNDKRAHVMQRRFKAMLLQAELSQQQIHTLRGMVKALVKGQG